LTVQGRFEADRRNWGGNKKQVQIVRTFFVIINMELGHNKCKKRGKLVHWQKYSDMYRQRNTRAEQEKPTSDSVLRKVAVCNVNK
jgi:hypothetical protein